MESVTNYIYTITNIVNEKLYVGRTKSPVKRRGSHFRKLRKGVHENPKLQNAWNKYGESCFIFSIVDECVEDAICELETKWFDKYDRDEEILYNCHFNSDGGKTLTAVGIQRNIDRLLPILQEGYDTGLGLNKLAKKHGVSSEYLANHISVWEEYTGLVYAHPQVKEALARLEVYVGDVMRLGAENCKHYTKYGVAHKTIHKHLFKIHGLTAADIDPREIARKKAINAVKMVQATGCSALKAIEECGSSVTTFYKYKNKLLIKE